MPVVAIGGPPVFTVEPPLVWPDPPRHLRADFTSPATSETFGELLSKNPSAFPSPIFEHRDFWSCYTPSYLAKSLLEIVAVNVVNEGCPSYSMKPIQRIRHVLLRTRFELSHTYFKTA